MASTRPVKQFAQVAARRRGTEALMSEERGCGLPDRVRGQRVGALGIAPRTCSGAHDVASGGGLEDAGDVRIGGPAPVISDDALHEPGRRVAGSTCSEPRCRRARGLPVPSPVTLGRAAGSTNSPRKRHSAGGFVSR